MTILNAFFYQINMISIRISLQFGPGSIIDNKSALVHVMAWRQRGEKPLPEPRLTELIWRIYAALGEDEKFHDKLLLVWICTTEIYRIVHLISYLSWWNIIESVKYTSKRNDITEVLCRK